MEFELLHKLLFECEIAQRWPGTQIFKPTKGVEWVADMFNKLPPVHEWSTKTDGHPLADYFLALEQSPPLSRSMLAVFNPSVLETFFKKCRVDHNISSQLHDLRMQTEINLTEVRHKAQLQLIQSRQQFRDSYVEQVNQFRDSLFVTTSPKKPNPPNEIQQRNHIYTDEFAEPIKVDEEQLERQKQLIVEKYQQRLDMMKQQITPIDPKQALYETHQQRLEDLSIKKETNKLLRKLQQKHYLILDQLKQSITIQAADIELPPKPSLQPFIEQKEREMKDELAKFKSFVGDHSSFIQEYFADLKDQIRLLESLYLAMKQDTPFVQFEQVESVQQPLVIQQYLWNEIKAYTAQELMRTNKQVERLFKEFQAVREMRKAMQGLSKVSQEFDVYSELDSQFDVLRLQLVGLQTRHALLKEMKLVIQKLTVQPDEQLEKLLIKQYKQAREKPADVEQSFISDISTTAADLSASFYERVNKFRYTDNIDTMLQPNATWRLPQNNVKLQSLNRVSRELRGLHSWLPQHSHYKRF